MDGNLDIHLCYNIKKIVQRGIEGLTITKTKDGL